MREYLQANKEFVRSYIEKELPQLSVISLDATYLLWIDCSKLTGTSSEFAHFLRKKTGLYLSEGKEYGGNGDLFVRMNIACPREVVQDGMERLRRGVEEYEKYLLTLC